MAFINYSEREDMQDDTYKIVAIRLDQALQAIIIKDIELSHSIIEGLYLLVGCRLKDKTIYADIQAITNSLYARGTDKDARLRSKALDACKEVYAKITSGLNDSGILFRAEANLNELYKRGG